MAGLDAHTATERTMTSQHHAPALQADLKRKRSPSHDTLHHASAPLAKSAKTHNHLQINYLARQLNEDLPLITNDDTLPNILSLLGDYQGVLDRHESMACNLGARPLGPILIKRFERLFDGPPRVLKSHGKDGTTVTWLDVVDFARNKPEQFQLGQMSEGVRVCQFYTKQCRVQISEEDFVLISSGIPQKMIPPQPIIEDEEKELGTIEILEKNLGQICQLADQVAARTRQLNHRLKGRKQAILDRRATASPAPPIRPTSPSNVALMNGAGSTLPNAPPAHSSQTSPSGFVAVNARPHHESNGNGTSSTTRHDLLAKFHTMSERRTSSHPPSSGTDARRPSLSAGGASHPSTPVPHVTKAPPKPLEGAPPNLARPPHMNENELHSMMHSPVPIPNTPSNLLPAASQRNSQPLEKDDGGPFKTEMVHKMEALAKGERILPPCDRCRRLHMDCLKNLTACMGCTKKHAKCSWKDVREGELRGGFAHPPASNSNVHSETSDHDSGDRASTASPMLTPPHHSAHTPQNVMHQPAQHQAEPPSHRPHATNEQPPQHHSPYDLPHNARIPPSRNSPPERDRARESNVETQLQEAAKSSVVHSNGNGNTRLGGSESSNSEFHQPMVA
ncbi:hypothetical protein HBH98_070460 [Parastagonospora nodorum]|nr:hypothetical protein HBH50_040390 [Parastagonospora nodorum]KAH4091464.1 hypothetical protein HBH48_092710 [Parastagonospora nodorum]KAH4207102.1 hypothetical protein HBI95_112330 [Parastagonospora nodorum]KAH4240123.1 hypothetical protein HBI06_029970 [Parastagonospora nodorum]KAH4244707.1 hypothetical protein HBI05_074420 [Parastagonospora nodorum]